MITLLILLYFTFLKCNATNNTINFSSLILRWNQVITETLEDTILYDFSYCGNTISINEDYGNSWFWYTMPFSINLKDENRKLDYPIVITSNIKPKDAAVSIINFFSEYLNEKHIDYLQHKLLLYLRIAYQSKCTAKEVINNHVGFLGIIIHKQLHGPELAINKTTSLDSNYALYSMSIAVLDITSSKDVEAILSHRKVNMIMFDTNCLLALDSYIHGVNVSVNLYDKLKYISKGLLDQGIIIIFNTNESITNENISLSLNKLNFNILCDDSIDSIPCDYAYIYQLLSETIDTKIIPNIWEDISMYKLLIPVNSVIIASCDSIGVGSTHDALVSINMINLENRKDKWDLMLEWTNQYPIFSTKFRRFNAIDGAYIMQNTDSLWFSNIKSIFSNNSINDSKHKIYNPYRLHEFLPGVIGAAMSHLYLWAALSNCVECQDDDYILILEDDVYPTSQFQSKFDNYLNVLNQDVSWDMVVFGNTDHRPNLDNIYDYPLGSWLGMQYSGLEGFNWLQCRGRLHGGWLISYIIRKRTAKLLLSHIQNNGGMQQPIDMFMLDSPCLIRMYMLQHPLFYTNSNKIFEKNSHYSNTEI